MSVGDYRIVPWTTDTIDPLVELHHRAFRMDADMSYRYLRWKYFSNPWLEPALFVALNHRDDVVGMRGFYGSCWRVDGRTVVLPCADDFAIAESHRNAGLMTEIMRVAIGELTRRGYSQLLTMSGGHATLLQSLATGWVSLGPVTPVARFSRAYRIGQWLERRSVKGLGSRRVDDFARLDSARQKSRPTASRSHHNRVSPRWPRWPTLRITAHACDTFATPHGGTGGSRIRCASIDTCSTIATES